jgi:hypothetical protein
VTRESGCNKNIKHVPYILNINYDESTMLPIIDKLFDKLPLLITTLEANRFGAKMLAVFIGFAVVTFALYVVLKSLPVAARV